MHTIMHSDAFFTTLPLCYLYSCQCQLLFSCRSVHSRSESPWWLSQVHSPEPQREQTWLRVPWGEGLLSLLASHSLEGEHWHTHTMMWLFCTCALVTLYDAAMHKLCQWSVIRLWHHYYEWPFLHRTLLFSVTTCRCVRASIRRRASTLPPSRSARRGTPLVRSKVTPISTTRQIVKQTTQVRASVCTMFIRGTTLLGLSAHTLSDMIIFIFKTLDSVLIIPTTCRSRCREDMVHWICLHRHRYTYESRCLWRKEQHGRLQTCVGGPIIWRALQLFSTPQCTRLYARWLVARQSPW